MVENHDRLMVLWFPRAVHWAGRLQRGSKDHFTETNRRVLPGRFQELFVGRQHIDWIIKGRRKFKKKTHEWNPEEKADLKFSGILRREPNSLPPFLNCCHHGLIWKVCSVESRMTRVDSLGFVLIPEEKFAKASHSFEREGGYMLYYVQITLRSYHYRANQWPSVGFHSFQGISDLKSKESKQLQAFGKSVHHLSCLGHVAYGTEREKKLCLLFQRSRYLNTIPYWNSSWNQPRHSN